MLTGHARTCKRWEEGNQQETVNHLEKTPWVPTARDRTAGAQRGFVENRHDTICIYYRTIICIVEFNGDMGFREFLHQQKINHGPQSKTRSEIVRSISDDANFYAQGFAESAPDLGDGPSALPTSGSPITPRSHGLKGARISLSRTICVTTVLCADFSISDRFRSVFRKGRSERSEPSDRTVGLGAPEPDNNMLNLKSLTSSAAKFILRGVKESADAFPPLKSVAGCLCFILDNCEVCSASLEPPKTRCSRSP
jgi:hypothetical protein